MHHTTQELTHAVIDTHNRVVAIGNVSDAEHVREDYAAEGLDVRVVRLVRPLDVAIESEA